MNKLVKVMISAIMSFSMVICLSSTRADAAEMINQVEQENGIAVASINIGTPYYISNGRGKLMAHFSSASTLLVTYYDLSNKSRYIKLNVSTSSKSFATRKFVVKAGGYRTESYNVNIGSASGITIDAYQFENSSSSSECIDLLKGIMP